LITRKWIDGNRCGARLLKYAPSASTCAFPTVESRGDQRLTVQGPDEVTTPQQIVHNDGS
jgi:hypothetical protein